MLERAPMRTAPNKAELQITPVSGRTVLRLKSWLPEFVTGGKPVVLAGQELPTQVGAILSGPLRVSCLGPGDWLIVLQEHPASSLREHIAPDLSTQGFALVDLTAGVAGLEVQGSRACEVLSKGCGLDLHPRNFPAGRCARTRFAQIPVIIECLDGPPRFELNVARSYFHYLYAWLTDAAAEFGDPLTGAHTTGALF